MRLWNHITGTCPLIAHGPGPKLKPRLYAEQNPVWEPLRTDLFAETAKACRIPTELALMTWNSRAEPGPFEQSLARFGIEPLVLGKGTRDWWNTMKLSLAAEALPSISEPYVLAADSNDVLVLRCIDELLDRFLELDCEALFNAETVFWPDVDGVMQEWKKRYETIDSPYRYLNAGVVIGKRDFLAEYYSRIQELDVARLIADGRLSPTEELSEETLVESEQVRHHWGFSEFRDSIRLDTRCELFQVIVFHDRSELVWEAPADPSSVSPGK